MKTCPDGTHCQNEYLIEELENKLDLCKHVAMTMTELHDQRVGDIYKLTAELAALREQVKNLQMSETHKVRVQAVKHMLEQTAFLRRCFALDVFRNYPRLRDEGLRILDGELPDVEGEVTE